jgi:hypothetical protein
MTDDGQIRKLIEGLNTLHDGEQAMLELISYGAEAIPHLQKFLLEGKSGIVYQPRQWAVQALGALGAKEALIEYLLWPRDISDPAIAYAEEAVEITAARELKKWHTDDVFYALLNIVAYRLQPGAIETLGEFGRAETLPYFIRALEDDICRPAAEQALEKFGEASRTALITTALRPTPSRDEESPSSLRRRESALKILKRIPISPQEWRLLRPLLSESNPGIVCAIARVALAAGSTEDYRLCERRLGAVLPLGDWFLQSEIEDCLNELAKWS